MKRTYLLLVCIICSFACFSQTPQLVKDINPGDGASGNSEMCVLNGKIIFNLSTRSGSLNDHNQLWVSDGTDAGTQLLKTFQNKTEIKCMRVLGNRVYFAANDSVHGLEVWSTDGTAVGTRLLKDINPNPGAGSLSQAFQSNYLTVVNDKLFFPANDSVHGTELWMSDGTGLGTTMVKNINPNDSCGIDTITFDYHGTENCNIAFQGKYYFDGNDGTHGDELWVSDGTDAGTKMIQVNTTSRGSWATTFMPATNNLYFMAATDSVGVWKTDGTIAGTENLTNAVAPYLSDYCTIGDLAIFLAYDGYKTRIWRTDGTRAGTYLLSDSINNIVYYYKDNVGKATGLTTLYSKAFFYKKNALWVTDGSISGTKQIFGKKSKITELTSVAGRLFFKVIDTVSGGKYIADVYYSDGTDTGTHKIIFPTNNTASYSVLPATINSAVSSFVAVGNTVYFFMSYDTSINTELYKLDMPLDVPVVNSLADEMKMWPNPVKENLTLALSMNGEGIVTIYNTIGQVVFRQPYKDTEKMQVDVRAFNAGMYFVQLNGMYAGKFVKE